MIGWVYIAQPDPGDLFVWLPVKRVQFDPTGAMPFLVARIYLAWSVSMGLARPSQVKRMHALLFGSLCG